MKRTKEVTDYEARFDGAVTEILAVTGANGFGGGKGPDEEYWTASIALTAWREPGGPVQAGELLLTAKADDALLAQLREAAGKDMVISARVRRGDGRLLLAGLPKKASDPELEAVLAEQLRPVFRDDPQLGRFTLDRSVNCFEAEAQWCGRTVALSYDLDGEQAMDDALETARRLFAGQGAWDARLREFAAEELLELKNDGWLDDGEEPLTAGAFMGRMALESIAAAPEGEFEFWFSDGDLFWGHSILVSGNLADGPQDADIAG